MQICYQCEAETEYLFDDSRCSKCTRLTPEEIRGEYPENTMTQENDIMFTARLVRETPKAYLLSVGSGPDIWIPKSQVRKFETAENGPDVCLVVSRWIAGEKGLV